MSRPKVEYDSELFRLVLNLNVLGGMTEREAAAELGVSLRSYQRKKRENIGVITPKLREQLAELRQRMEETGNLMAENRQNGEGAADEMAGNRHDEAVRMRDKLFINGELRLPD